MREGTPPPSGGATARKDQTPRRADSLKVAWGSTGFLSKSSMLQWEKSRLESVVSAMAIMADSVTVCDWSSKIPGRKVNATKLPMSAGRPL